MLAIGTGRVFGSYGNKLGGVDSLNQKARLTLPVLLEILRLKKCNKRSCFLVKRRPLIY